MDESLDFILKHLTNNKVSVKITPKKYNELNVCVGASGPEGTDPFACFTDLASKFKSIRPPPSQGAAARRYNAHDNAHDNNAPHATIDPLLYCFHMACVDPTISLLPPQRISETLAKYKVVLVEALENHLQLYKQLKLKTATKCSCDDIKAAITTDHKHRTSAQVSSILSYLARRYEKHVMYDTQLYEASSTKNMTTLKINTSSIPFAYDIVTSNMSDLKNESISAVKQNYMAENILQKLTTYCVKDLKEIAKNLRLSLTKEEDGKSKPLLKAELVGAIERCLTST